MPLFHTSTVGQIDDTSSTGTLSAVASVTTSAVILAANTNRKGAFIHNKSTSNLYLTLSATASAVAFTAPLEPGDYWESPYPYTGVISGIWSAVNGSALITELT